MSRRWQRALRVFPLASEFNVPYARCAGGELLSLDVLAVYTASGSTHKRLEPVAYWQAHLDALLEQALRETLGERTADEVCRRRLATARAVAERAALSLGGDRVELTELELLAPTLRPLGGAAWARRCAHNRFTVPTPRNDDQAPNHQEVHTCPFI